MAAVYGISIRTVILLCQLATTAAALLLLLEIFTIGFGFSFLRTPVTGGGQSLQTTILTIIPIVFIIFLPQLKKRKWLAFLPLTLLAYCTYSILFNSSVGIELKISSYTDTYGIWTSNPIFINLSMISIALILIQTKYQITGATFAFCSAITPLHLILIYIFAPGYLENHIPLDTALILVLTSTATLLRYATRMSFRKFFLRHSNKSLQIIFVGFVGIFIQQTLVLFDIYRDINTKEAELLLIQFPIQYLLFRYVYNQHNSYQTVIKYGKAMHRNATKDPLTGCGNRQSLREVIEDLNTTGIQKVGLIIFDIDHFKLVNDKYGHEVGDAVLVELTQLVRSHIPEGTPFIRWGGEEFLVIRTFEDEENLLNFAENIRNHVNGTVFNTVNTINISLGCAYGDTNSFDKLTSNADHALYFSKERGRNRSTLADQDFIQNLYETGASVDINEVRSAILNHELFFVGQPIKNVATDELVAIEALLRWRRPKGEIMVPNQFLDKLNQLILTEPMLYELFTKFKTEFLANLSGQYPEAAIAFNMTIDELYKPECMMPINELIEYAIRADRRLIFELSETNMSPGIDISLINSKLIEFQNLGVRIALDHFGSGSNNLRNLMKLNIDIVKLSPEIAANTSDQDKSVKVLSSLALMMHNLKVDIFIEGVDDINASRALKWLGYPFQQGYFIGKTNIGRTDHSNLKS